MKIGGLIEQGHLVMYTVTSLKDQPGSAGKVLKVFAQEGINIQYITEGTCQHEYAVIAFCIDADDSQRVDALLKENIEAKFLNIKKVEYISILGIYGPHFREKPGIAATFCAILGEAGVNILGISSSISTISCVIDVREAEKAKEVILSRFELP
jgi:aspartokinase